jgi:hypothetical protein
LLEGVKSKYIEVQPRTDFEYDYPALELYDLAAKPEFYYAPQL